MARNYCSLLNTTCFAYQPARSRHIASAYAARCSNSAGCIIYRKRLYTTTTRHTKLAQPRVLLATEKRYLVRDNICKDDSRVIS